MEKEQEQEKEREKISLIIDDLYNNVIIHDPPSLDHRNIEEDRDLDTSWIEDHERLSTIHGNYIREPMEHIHIYFIYINRNSYIDKIVHDKQLLLLSSDKRYSYLPKETLLHIIQTRKIKTPFSKYKLADVLSYLVDLEPEAIQYYSKNDNLEQIHSTFLKVLPIMNDIKIDPSIFIFHEMNALYFLFEEVELINHRHSLRSILKPSSSLSSVSDKTNTKKVRIQTSSLENPNKKKNKGTRKKMI